MLGGLEGARVPNPDQDHRRFGVDNSFGRGELEVALREGLEHSFPDCAVAPLVSRIRSIHRRRSWQQILRE